VAVSTPWVRGYLRWVWASAQAASLTLSAQLTALNTAAIAGQSTGQTIQSTSGNGRMVSFSGGGTNTKFPSEGVSPGEIVETLDRLLSLYDQAVAAGQTTDAARVTWMLGRLASVRRVQHRFDLTGVNR